MARVGEMLDKGIKVNFSNPLQDDLELIKHKVGLGTDVSGGFSPSMLTAVQHASICSKMVALQITTEASNRFPSSPSKFAGKQLQIATLLYLVTIGGASLCNMSDRIGSFSRGKSFDALIVSVRPETGNPAIWSTSDEFSKVGSHPKQNGGGKDAKKILDAWLERFLFGGDDRNIRQVFVQGRCIGGKDFKH